MKIIHCADLHLDSDFIGFSREKSRIRREECLRTFERMVDFAVQNSVKVIIIAGDMFDSNKVSNRTASRVLKTISNNSEIDFLYLSGNHDENGLFFDFFSDLKTPSNFKFFDKTLTKFVYDNVCICGVDGSVPLDRFFYENLCFNSSDVNLLCMHGQIAGYKTDEKNVDLISLPNLKEKNIDYLALGHYHSFSVGEIDLRGKYAYSGCLEGRGFDETGDKGFVLIDTDTDKLSFNFVKFAQRGIFEHFFSISGYTNWLDAEQDLISQLKSSYNKESIIKVVLNGERSLNFYIDLHTLKYRLEEWFFHVKIQDKTSLKVNLLDFENDKSVKGEFVRSVLQSDLSEEDKSKVLSCGFNALSGEELL